ncbi:hypothetical protein Tco_0385847 [Tanacetum coccineum]
MGNWGFAVKTSEHPLKNMVNRGIFDSGCSGHMTGNKDQLEDFEEFNGGSVTFGEDIEIRHHFIRDCYEKKLISVEKIHTDLNVADLLTKPFDGPRFNYLVVSIGTSEKTNNVGTSQTPKSNASEEKDEDVELIVVPSTVTLPEKNKDNPKIQDFRGELEQIALKHLETVPKNNTTSTPLVNTGSQAVNTGRLDHDDSPMPELEIFHKSETRIFDEASYDEEGVITDFNSLPTEIEVSPTPTLRIHNIHRKLGFFEFKNGEIKKFLQGASPLLDAGTDPSKDASS